MRPKRPQFSFPRLLTEQECADLLADSYRTSREAKRLIAARKLKTQETPK
jgi:hypothetical protein